MNNCQNTNNRQFTHYDIPQTSTKNLIKKFETNKINKEKEKEVENSQTTSNLTSSKITKLVPPSQSLFSSSSEIKTKKTSNGSIITIANKTPTSRTIPNVVKRYAETVEQSNSPTTINKDLTTPLENKIKALTTIDQKKLAMNYETREEYENKIKQYADELADLAFQSLNSPEFESKIQQMHLKLKAAANGNLELQENIEKQAKAVTSIIKSFRQSGLELSKEETLSQFIAKNGVESKDIDLEAAMFNQTKKIAALKIAKRTINLIRAGNQTKYTGAFTKTAEELKMTPSSVKAAYKIFKETLETKIQETKMFQFESDHKKTVLFSTGEDLFVEKGTLGKGAYKATTAITRIFGKGNIDLVAQKPLVEEASSLPKPNQTKPATVFNLNEKEEESDDEECEGTCFFDSAKTAVNLEDVINRSEKINDQCYFGAMNLDQLKQLREHLEKQPQDSSTQESLKKTEARIDQFEKFQKWYDKQTIEDETDEEAYFNEIEIQKALQGNYLEKIYNVIVVQDAQTGKVSKTILKQRAGFHLNEEHSPHDLKSLYKLAKQGKLSSKEFVMGMDSFMGVMKGMGELANEGYVHRDLKLENVLLYEQGESKITDFGTMVKIENDPKKYSYAGTPKYSSPELALTRRNLFMGEDMTEQSDIWSLGMMLHEYLIEGGIASHPIWHPRGAMNMLEAGPEIQIAELANVYSDKEERKKYKQKLQKYQNDAQTPEAKKIRTLIADCTRLNPKKRPTIEEVIVRYTEILREAKKNPGSLYNPEADAEHPKHLA